MLATLAIRETDERTAFRWRTEMERFEEARIDAEEKFETGKQKIVDIAGDLDQRVHRNPWAYIGGAAVAALLLGLLLSRSRRD
jgi:ElaB/YqjD/DUF883 family membrane-anchored ribosome-binding protein